MSPSWTDVSENGKKEWKSQIPVPSAGKTSVAVCDQLCAADKRRFGKKIGELSSEDMALLNESLKTVLGL